MYLEFTKDNMLRSWILNGSNTAEYDNCVLYTSPDLNWSEIAGSPMPYKIQGNTLVFNGNTYEVENGSGRVILQSGNDGEIIYRINKFEVR